MRIAVGSGALICLSLSLSFGAALGATGCRRSVPAPPARDLDAPARMVLTERWRAGGRLIIVDETGDRLAPLLVPGTTADGEPAVDEHPAFSPDGRWVVFASTRARADRRTSLWIAEARPDAVPRRLTTGAADLDPTWTPSGDAVVFASDRGGVSIDLYQLPMKDGFVAGTAVQLTDAPTHELAPAMVGARLVLQLVEPTRGVSRIAERTADGALVALTDGPGDGAPALAPDGRTLAYASARLRLDGERDLDVVVIDLDDEGRERHGVALEGTDEGAPTWSSDGRWLFVTSILRDVEGAPLLSSVLHLDTWGRPPRLRMLRDAAGAAPRLGATLARGDLDQTSLLRNPDYATALRNALVELQEAEAAAREREEARARRDSSAPSTLTP